MFSVNIINQHSSNYSTRYQFVNWRIRDFGYWIGNFPFYDNVLSVTYTNANTTTTNVFVGKASFSDNSYSLNSQILVNNHPFFMSYGKLACNNTDCLLTDSNNTKSLFIAPFVSAKIDNIPLNTNSYLLLGVSPGVQSLDSRNSCNLCSERTYGVLYSLGSGGSQTFTIGDSTILNSFPSYVDWYKDALKKLFGQHFVSGSLVDVDYMVHVPSFFNSATHNANLRLICGLSSTGGPTHIGSGPPPSSTGFKTADGVLDTYRPLAILERNSSNHFGVATGNSVKPFQKVTAYHVFKNVHSSQILYKVTYIDSTGSVVPLGSTWNTLNVGSTFTVECFLHSVFIEIADIDSVSGGATNIRIPTISELELIGIIPT